MNIIDARGLSCPQPVILVKNALGSNPAACEILVDNNTAVENITRFSEHAGYSVSVKDEGSDFHLTVKKEAK